MFVCDVIYIRDMTYMYLFDMCAAIAVFSYLYLSISIYIYMPIYRFELRYIYLNIYIHIYVHVYLSDTCAATVGSGVPAILRPDGGVDRGTYSPPARGPVPPRDARRPRPQQSAEVFSAANVELSRFPPP